MNLSNALLATGWLIRMTIRQSLASKLFWAMLFFSSVVILFCLGAKVNDQNTPRLPKAEGDLELALPTKDKEVVAKGKESILREGVQVEGDVELSLGFGLITSENEKNREQAVRFVQVRLGGLIAGTVGIFLAIIWTAGFLPTFLEPTQATVLIAKPIPRWSLLLGQIIGVLVFVGFQVSVFVIGTWLALGISTGIFDARYLFTIPILLLHFTIFYSFSVMLAVWTRNTVVCVFGTLLIWVVCWGMNFGRHTVVYREPPGISTTSRSIIEMGYWILPKPGDMNLVLDDALQTRGFAGVVPEFQGARDKNRINLPLSVVTCLAFSIWMFGVAAWEFRQTEY